MGLTIEEKRQRVEAKELAFGALYGRKPGELAEMFKNCTATGRMSSSKPNPSNEPRSDVEELLGADYDDLERRLAEQLFAEQELLRIKLDDTDAEIKRGI